jgi:SAM-dependent methyltransferase
MFTKSGRYYDALYHFIDYRAAADRLHELIRQKSPAAASLLDVACGTGRHLQHLRESFEVEGLDIDSQLLAAARERCPGVPFHQGSMVDFDLPRKFDVVTCLFSAIGYVQTPDAMRQAVANMARHLRPGGLLIVEPWFEPDRYWTDTVTANHVDQPDLKICWMYTSKRVDRVSVLDIHFLVGTSDRVEHFVEQHRVGLFTREEHVDAMTDAGLEVTFDPEGPSNRGLYVGRRPSETS